MVIWWRAKGIPRLFFFFLLKVKTMTDCCWRCVFHLFLAYEWHQSPSVSSKYQLAVIWKEIDDTDICHIENSWRWQAGKAGATVFICLLTVFVGSPEYCSPKNSGLSSVFKLLMSVWPLLEWSSGSSSSWSKMNRGDKIKMIHYIYCIQHVNRWKKKIFSI